MDIEAQTKLLVDAGASAEVAEDFVIGLHARFGRLSFADAWSATVEGMMRSWTAAMYGTGEAAKRAQYLRMHHAAQTILHEAAEFYLFHRHTLAHVN